jgi:hypothetical protein
VTRVPGLPGAIASSYMKLRYRVGDETGAKVGREKTLAALDRLERSSERTATSWAAASRSRT